MNLCTDNWARTPKIDDKSKSNNAHQRYCRRGFYYRQKNYAKHAKKAVKYENKEHRPKEVVRLLPTIRVKISSGSIGVSNYKKKIK